MARLHDRAARGLTRTGWLESHHSFSFGGFRDPTRMGYRDLRVLNEDYVIPGAGFAEHAHRDMEIISLVLSGALEHRDSMGRGSVIRPGEAQLLSAGSGVTHSERNASAEVPLHFLQIWILPARIGEAPDYQQVAVKRSAAASDFTAIATPDGGEGLLAIKQDARLLLSSASAGEIRHLHLASGRAGFLQVISGLARVEGESLSAGDGLEFLAGEITAIEAVSDCQLLLFDLA